ncbi:hypothetical protein E6Q11_05995 [Candidatus Dojkabacteria bacterium]|uniref:Uncharacterized protein n=1 Tax=Candidatus Dojkabacteria bacterium TaxID=2099670 RepID=A0A5C7J320_9BACT|nr:MAG: hypothetical protein E6Q11_05995 [Candidatus Dojkabacteria bacterium]
MSDLWKYNPVTGQWSWMNGDMYGDRAGIYTELDDLGLPGARMDANSWVDALGALWLFGGYGWDKNRLAYISRCFWKVFFYDVVVVMCCTIYMLIVL